MMIKNLFTSCGCLHRQCRKRIEKCLSLAEIGFYLKIVSLNVCIPMRQVVIKVTEQIECTAVGYSTDNYPAVFVQKGLVSCALDSVLIVYTKKKQLVTASLKYRCVLMQLSCLSSFIVLL